MNASRVSAAVAACFGLVSAAGADPGGPDAGPSEAGQGGRIVTDAEGVTRYEWPPVPDGFVESAPVGEIAAWVRKAWSDAAHAVQFGQRRAAARGESFDVVTIRPGVEPLSPAQWNTLAGRAAAALAADGPDADPDADRDALQVFALMDLVPQPGWPQDGFRAGVDALLDRAAGTDAPDGRGMAHLAADLAARCGDTGYLRRVTDLMRATQDPDRKVRLGLAAAAAEFGEHDLGPAEAAVVGTELLAVAEESGQPLPRIAIAGAALRVGGLVSIRLMEDALGSAHADVRGAAVRWAGQRVRTARQEGDAPAERALVARADRFVAAIEDPDDRVASSALGTVMIVFENDPAAWADAMLRGLGSRPPVVDATACVYLMEHPGRAAPAAETLRRLARSPDPDLRRAASDLLGAIRAAGGGAAP